MTIRKLVTKATGADAATFVGNATRGELYYDPAEGKLYFAGSASIGLTSPISSVGDAADIQIVGGNTTLDDAVGGDIQLVGGDNIATGSASGGQGASLRVRGGDAAKGGDLYIYGGGGDAANNGDGGDIRLYAGDKGGTGDDGKVRVIGGFFRLAVFADTNARDASANPENGDMCFVTGVGITIYNDGWEVVTAS